MILKESIEGNVAVIEVEGKLMGGDETRECHKRLKSVLSKGYKNIVIDLSRVQWVNSLGMGMLIACYTSCTNAGGELRIGGVSKKTKSMLEMMKLTTVFKVFENKDIAVKSY